MATQKNRILAATWAVVLLAATPGALAQFADTDVAAPATQPAGADATTAPAAADTTTAPAVTADTPGARTRDEKLAQIWENLLHYLRIAQVDAAKSYGQALLDLGAKPTEIYHLSIESRSALSDLARGRNLDGMKDIVTQILKLVEEGYVTERSDPTEIRNAIELLGGTTRAYIRGRDRLLVSGEYAIPQLLRRLADPETSVALRERIMVVLPKIGKDAVLPLMCALQTKDPQLRQVIANTLGQIEYPTALPRLKELYDKSDLQPQTRRIVQAAMISCAGGDLSIFKKPTAQLFYNLAVSFYYRAESLLPDLRSNTANVWYWQDDALGFKAVPRPIFCDIYAMRMSRLTLQHDPKFYPAVSLWLAANMKRTDDLPAGAADPTRKSDEPPPEFYTLAAGAKYEQDVLARALRDKDWAVAIGAIEALGRTAGAETMVEPVAGGAQPLVEALASSNRVVRYWAALSLATALPSKRFTGCELVMPILNSAVRQTGKKTLVVIAAEPERRNTLKDAARTLGYNVIDEPDITQGLVTARASLGADVAVLDSNPDPMIAVAAIRRDPLLVTLPVVIMGQTDRLQALAKGDLHIRLVNALAKPDEIAAGIDEAVKASAGKPLTPEQATQWAVRAASAIRTLGLTRTAVYDISRTREVLIVALDDPRTEVRVAAAQALATMPDPQAQRAVAGLAIGATADEAVRLAAFAALDESVRRFGNSLDDKQAHDIVDIVMKATGQIRQSAAEILGAMSLPSSEIKDLILKTNGD